MAQLAVAIAIGQGALTAGSMSAILYGSLAAVLDSAFVLPALFPQPDVRGPRLNDFRFGTVDEGEPMTEVYGRNIRVACHVLDQSEMFEDENTHSTNGKGGRSGEFIEYTYSKHLMVSICRGPISKVKKIWANTRLIYNEDPDVDITSDQLTGSASKFVQYGFGGLAPALYTKYYLKISSPSGGPDLSAVRIGQTVTLSNTANPVDDGEWEVVDSAQSTNGSTYFKVSRDSRTGGVAFTSFVAGSVTPTVLQDLETYDTKCLPETPEFAAGSDGRMGTHDQPVDTLFEALRGVGNVPAYRGQATFRLKNLQLVDFGNVLPNFSALVEEDPERTVGEALELIARDGGLAATSVSADVDVGLDGYQIRGPMPVAQKLQPLMLAYETMSWEDDGVLRFVRRRDLDELALDDADLAASEEGADTHRPLLIQDSEEDPPERYTVRFIDRARDYQVGQRSGFRQSLSNGIVRQIDLPVSLWPFSAEDLATHLVWLESINSRRVTLQLPPKYIPLVHEAMRVTFNAKGRAWRVLVLGIDRAQLSGLLVVTGVVDEAQLVEDETARANEADDSTLGSGSQHRSAASLPVDFNILDCSALSDEHTKTPGVYITAALTTPNEHFSAASLYESIDIDGETWQRVLTIREAATMGLAQAALGTGTVGAWDEANTLDVELTGGGELTSATELECLNGANRAMVGLEIIGFRSATLIDENVYRLSGLLRGLRDTSEHVGTHVEGDRFILLTGPGVYFMPLSVASVGMTRYYRCASSGAVLDSLTASAHEFQGETVKPFAPCNATGERDGSNNLAIVWTRVTRANVRLLSMQACPVIEPEEGYELDVLDGGGDVLRTIQSAMPSVIYTAAQQTADGLTPGDPVDVAIHQTSDLLRRGRPLYATV